MKEQSNYIYIYDMSRKKEVIFTKKLVKHTTHYYYLDSSIESYNFMRINVNYHN